MSFRYIPYFRRCALAFFAWLLLITTAGAATQFSYTLPPSHRPYWTSAGVFKSDGTLVRTLWRKEIKSAGTYSATWDELDDEGNAAQADTYELRVLHHQIDYVWEGAIGNTSADKSGPTVHGSFYPIRDMAIGGAQGFYAADYNEGTYDYHSFLTSDPQRLTDKWLYLQRISGPGQAGQLQKETNNIYNRSWNMSASDGTWVYLACPNSTDPTAPYPRGSAYWNTYKGFVMACETATHAQAYFTNGQQIPNGALSLFTYPDGTTAPYEGAPYPSGVYIGSQPGLCGLAVQTTGNVLAGAVGPDNKVYLLHKRTGAALGEIAVPSPRRIEFAPNGDLWICSGNSVLRYTSVETAPVLAGRIDNLIKPLDVAIHPTSDLVLVADGGGSQQIKAFTAAGVPLWNFGLIGGQPAHGPEVASNVFWFITGKLSSNTTADEEDTYLAFQPDGSFWVGDGGNWRALHFSARLTLLHTLAFQPHCYSCSVVEANPERVFSGFLELQVDYTKPLEQSWQLLRNWAWNLGPEYHGKTTSGLRTVATLSNGRTYAMVTRWINNTQYINLAELTASGLRLTPVTIGASECFTRDGTLRTITATPANWTQRRLTGFDANGDPQYTAQEFLASATNGALDPAPYCCGSGLRRVAVTSTGVLISFDQVDSGGSPAVTHNNFHLGGVRVGSTKWLWRASPAVTALDNRGGFEVSTTSITYAGSTAISADRHVMYGYHGEFFRNAGQAGQFMHWWDDGLFIGQFGEASINHQPWEVKAAGFAGNGFSPALVRAPTGEYYLYTNDESAHGVQRWHVVGAQTIRELTGQAALGGSATLTAAAPAFPAITSALPGNARATLAWSPVAGAVSYRVRYGTTDGGPYAFVTEVPGPTVTIGGLANGVPHYFTVSAVTGAGEGPASAQARIYPFDTTATVQLAATWRTTLRPQVFNIDSTAPAAGRPAVTSLAEVIGDVTFAELFHRAGSDGQLPVIEMGRKGYAFFNYSGTGADVVNAVAPFSVTRPASGWANDNRFTYFFTIDGVAQASDYGVKTTTSAALNIGASDNGPTDWHCLTVALPRQSADAREVTLRLARQGQSSSAAQYDTGAQLRWSSFADLVQFLFRGPVTLTTIKGPTAFNNAALQGVFLDGVPVTTALTPIETWKSATLGNVNAPETTDTDRDGLSDLAEYALGLSPTLPDTSTTGAVEGRLTLGGADYLALTFRRDPARYDIDYSVEVSPDLQTWSTVANSIADCRPAGPAM